MSADFDKAIDRAVCEMLDVEPPADLRARVIERIEQPRGGARGWMWVAAPLAAAAVIVLGVMMHPAPQPMIGAQPVARVEPSPVPQPNAAPVALVPRRAPRTTERPPRSGRGTRSVDEAPWVASAMDVTVDPLPRPGPITVHPLEPRPIERPEVRIAALPAIAPIAIEPLPPDGGRH